MKENEMLQNGIVELLPQVPYVIDQVGDAIKWASEVLDDGELNTCLKKAINVAKYASKTSEANFFKTHLVIASILADIKDKFEDITKEEKFERFDSASKAVVNTLQNLTIDKDVILERGCFQALIMHLIPLATVDQDAFVIMLYGVLNDLQQIAAGMLKAGVKSPITQNDYITVLGYALLIDNIYHSNLNILHDTQVLLNDIQIVLNNFSY